MSLLVAFALLGCCGCAPSPGVGGDSGEPPSERPVEEDEAADVLDLAGLLEDASGSYDELARAGLSWRDNGNRVFGVEAWPDAMVDSGDSHPIWDALERLGVDQPVPGEDYFVGPAYVCLGSGLSPSTRDDASPRAVLAPDEVAAGEAPDSVALCAPVNGRLSPEQLDAVASGAGFSGEDAASFVYDDAAASGVFSEVRAGTMGSGDLLWYVEHFGNASGGGSCVLRLGILPMDVARNLVETSALRKAGQIGPWPDEGDDSGRAALFSTAAAQEAISEGGTWRSVVTGELMA